MATDCLSVTPLKNGCEFQDDAQASTAEHVALGAARRARPSASCSCLCSSASAAPTGVGAARSLLVPRRTGVVRRRADDVSAARRARRRRGAGACACLSAPLMGVDAVGSLLARRKADARRAVRLHAVAAMVAITLDRRY